MLMFRVTAALAGAAALLPAQDDPRAEYRRLMGELREKQQAVSRAYTEARAAGQERPDIDFEAPVRELLPEFRKAAETHAGSAAAVQFLSWIATNALRTDQDVARQAIDTLMLDHLKSPELGPLASSLEYARHQLGTERTHEYLSRIVKDNPHDAVLSKALFARGSLYLGFAATGTDAELAQAKADLREAAKLDSKLGDRAEGMIFESENLSVGCVAPDIAGEDLDRVEFKLSDYRGKVVFLDFWGDW